MFSLIKLAEKLPDEESKQYYVNKIKVFINDIRIKHCFQSQKDFVSILLSILIRLFLNNIDEINEEDAVEEEIEHMRKSIVISKVIGSINSAISQISHQKDMHELLNNIKKGDDKSIFKAITIDKTLVSSELVKNRIAQAQITGDNKFLKKLANAIDKRPLEGVGQHGRTYAVLNLFWSDIELYKLNNQELYHFLKSCGFCLGLKGYSFILTIPRSILPVATGSPLKGCSVKAISPEASFRTLTSYMTVSITSSPLLVVTC